MALHLSVLLLAQLVLQARLEDDLAELFNGTADVLDNVTWEDHAWHGICLWSDWSPWAACDCDANGMGTASRERLVVWESQFAGDACSLLATEAKYCSSQCELADVSCDWQDWGQWSACVCSSTSGAALQSRERARARDEDHNQSACGGEAVERVSCDEQKVCTGDYMVLWIASVIVIKFSLGMFCLNARRGFGKVVPMMFNEADEDVDDGLDPDWQHSLPEYWSNSKQKEPGSFHELVYVNSALHSVFNDFLTATYLARCTQDRPCPSGKCVKTPLGCPCVQPCGVPGLPVGYRVHGVIRTECSAKWRRYDRCRRSLAELRHTETLPGFEPLLLGSSEASRHPEAFAPLEPQVNEAYAMHGTSVRSALCIVQEDFRTDLAGRGAGSMYGRGCYLAESSTKADEYARSEATGCYADTFAILLCRVCMGRFYYTTERDNLAVHAVASGDFDSTFGDRERSAGTFRELVVYNKDQVYPEYILLYKRVHRDDDLERIPHVSLNSCRLELPIYWKNCHRNIWTEVFVQQFRVRASTLSLLQRLVCKSLVDTQWQVVRARRVENSRIWLQYIKYKESLRSRSEPLVLSGCTAEDDADNPVAKLLRSSTFEEQVVSLNHIDESLNEQVLWHGTCQESAESIVKYGFRMTAEGERDHRKRFGRGIYFAETLSKSLTYATDEGASFVLLCRVACGRAHLTEALEDPGARARALRGGCDSVLANPEGVGPREFVALRQEQVYPEYILELVHGAPPSAEKHQPADSPQDALQQRHPQSAPVPPEPRPEPSPPPPVVLGAALVDTGTTGAESDEDLSNCTPDGCNLPGMAVDSG